MKLDELETLLPEDLTLRLIRLIVQANKVMSNSTLYNCPTHKLEAFHTYVSMLKELENG